MIICVHSAFKTITTAYFVELLRFPKNRNQYTILYKYKPEYYLRFSSLVEQGTKQHIKKQIIRTFEVHDIAFNSHKMY